MDFFCPVRHLLALNNVIQKLPGVQLQFEFSRSARARPPFIGFHIFFSGPFAIFRAAASPLLFCVKINISFEAHVLQEEEDHGTFSHLLSV